MEAGVGGHAPRCRRRGLPSQANQNRKLSAVMADAVLFEFLHMEMVAELWARGPDPGPGGQKTSLSVLESVGFRVGQALGERLPRETLAFREELDALKFLCKDLWVALFQKQIDGLRTNHQGTYVLQDNSFPLLTRMASGLQYLEEAPKFLAFTCGLLRGALITLGLKSLVTASVAALPTCPRLRLTPAFLFQL
ncbi:trafficking protein particle complex subunit 6A isoform X1 [Tamandua tetradactyla]|uniref:trafficking protein particle complex subunit 6A isoform X1 n=1 Tax=Tamandua tetradactyla TaxID=48850 RepID=UPI0040548F6E